ncbi:LuxR C-terminal-related transcriptional regulator [Azospirillum sp. B506]|uniref:LuxR C-terminal-related transcriptional regulator n=1 Tax=Azospirillum sp. B506 TaxID=137721 RepID=UPI000344ECD5|nr:LuxR C-terminal-related transcriptional regulator [Azospirillum sp. B506]
MLNSLHQNYISLGSAVYIPDGVIHTPKSINLPLTAAMFRPSYIAAIAPPAAGTCRLAKLSARRRDVAILAARGLSNKQIGRELGITEGTVKVHLTAAMKDLGAERRYDLPGLLMTERPITSTRGVHLTPRQNEVLALIAEGQRSGVIAARLGVGPGTVKQHITAILRALKVANRAGAVTWWLQHGEGRHWRSMQTAKAEG